MRYGLKDSRTWRKMSIFVGVQIQLSSAAFTLGIRITLLVIRITRPNFTFSLLRKLSGIGIRITRPNFISSPPETLSGIGIRITRPNFISSPSKILYGIGIRITRPNLIFSPPKTLSVIEIRIQTSGIRITRLGCWIFNILNETFALGVRFISETLSNLIRNHNKSVLVSSKSNKGSTGCAHNMAKLSTMLGDYKVWRNSLPPFFL